MESVPAPTYLIPGEQRDKTLYRKDEIGQLLYQACAEGNLQNVKNCASNPSITLYELEFGLEEAFQSFQFEVLEHLLTETDVKLHYRCFRRGDRNLENSENVFTSGSEHLCRLLQMAIKFGWLPNQLIGPPRPPRIFGGTSRLQDLALHHPRCIVDIDILRLLLESGADSTLGRTVYKRSDQSWEETPVRRSTGDILEMAVNMGPAENVELLFEYGATANPDSGMLLHSLVRRDPDTLKSRTMNDSLRRELWMADPEVEAPNLESRFSMVELLLEHGADINKVADVFRHVGRYTQISCISHLTTPIAHAKHSLDWDMVELLLKNGADPTLGSPQQPRQPHPDQGIEVKIRQQQWLRDYQIYQVGVSPYEIERKYDELVRKYKPN